MVSTAHHPLYPIPTAETRRIVQQLSEYARALDFEAGYRTSGGQHDSMIRDELMRSAGTVRLVITLVMNGSYSTRRAKFWLASTRAYLALVRRADRSGIIR